MDPLATIVSAIVLGAAAAAQDSAAQAVKDAYGTFKAFLTRKFSTAPNSEELTSAVRFVEKKPEDRPRREVLAQELQAAGVERDGDVLKLAQAVIDLLKQHDPAITAVYDVKVEGSGAAAAGTGARAAGEHGVIVDGDVQGGVNTGSQTTVNTGGGAYVGGNVQTNRDFVGRDQITNNYYGLSTGQEDAPGVSISPEGRTLNRLLDGYFSLSDIEGLCFEMGIDEENLRGQTKAEKARALVSFCQKNDRLSDLKKLMRVQRPNLRDQLM